MLTVDPNHANQNPELTNYPDILEVRLNKDRTSKLYTRKAFNKDEVIISMKNGYYTDKSYQTVQISEHDHVYDKDIIYLNHSCDPSVNLKVYKTADGKPVLELIASRDLKVDDELTFFYPSTEWDMDEPFNCWCHSSRVSSNLILS
jgi:hypothetical protein